MPPSPAEKQAFDALQSIGVGGAVLTFGDWWANVFSPILHGIILVLTVITLAVTIWHQLKPKKSCEFLREDCAEGDEE